MNYFIDIIFEIYHGYVYVTKELMISNDIMVFSEILDLEQAGIVLKYFADGPRDKIRIDLETTLFKKFQNITKLS